MLRILLISLFISGCSSLYQEHDAYIPYERVNWSSKTDVVKDVNGRTTGYIKRN
jgi:uncharacterized protein YceK